MRSQQRSNPGAETEQSCCYAASTQAKRGLNLIFMLLVGVRICAPPALAGEAPSGASQDKLCGPPIYCARTDRRVEPYPPNPPTLGPAGSILTDPKFGSRILRVTDSKTDPVRAGRSLYTPSSGEQNPWNSTSTRFYVLTPGGQDLLYEFDPSSMTAHQKDLLKVGWGGEPQFSYAQPNILYGTGRRDPVFEQYDVSNGRLTTVHNASECVKLNVSDGAHSVTVSADDSRLMTSLGPQQDKNYIIYIYDRKQGCRWYNTQTGEIGGKWGPKGIVSLADRLLIHNARMSKSGKFVYIARGNPSPHHRWVVWEIETMNVVLCPSQCSGHRALGYSHIVGPTGENHPMDMVVRPLNRLEASSPLITGLEHTSGYWYDQHFSWNNVNEDDTNPICLSTYRPSNPDTPGTPPQVTGPWENEIDCVETDGKGSKVWRFAHTYSTAKNGFWSTPRGNVSPDGRLYMFTSDWEDQLGRSPDGKWYRTDVFIVELR